jgi:hypothetical protein
MNYDYKYRLGLLVERNGFIAVITKEDLASYYSEPQVIRFSPIRLTDDVVRAFGFKKSRQRLRGQLCYIYKDVALVRRPYKDLFYCRNIIPSPNMKYLHELQDFLSWHYPFNFTEMVLYSDFVTRYGSRKLNDWDIIHD